MALLNVSTGDAHVPAHNTERQAINANETAVGLRIPKPANPRVGELLRFDGTNWVASATRLFEGFVQPEGNVAAPIGSRYVDTSSTEGAVEWIKRSGIATSNTGWRLVAADTLWRNISNLIDKRTTGVVNAAMLRRTNDTVDLYLDLKMPTNTASPYPLFTLPAGFRPGFTRYGLLQDNNEAAAASTAILSSGVVQLYSPSSGKTDRFNGTWTTTDAWPTVLPGI